MGKRGLGRGLSALIPETVTDAEARVREVPVDQVVPNPYQPRTLFDPIQMEELINSIKEHGVLQPILLREAGHERFQIVAGERRFRAAQGAGLKMVPAIVRECSDRELLEMAIVENVQRVDIGPMEAARAYRRMMDEFEMTQEMVAQRVGKSRPVIGNLVRLLELPEMVQDSVEQNQISEGHAKALLKIKDPAMLERAWERVRNEALSVRATENLIETMLSPISTAKPALAPAATNGRVPATTPGNVVTFAASDPHQSVLANDLQQHLGTKVYIRRDARGMGKIEIEFYADQDLERIADLLLGQA